MNLDRLRGIKILGEGFQHFGFEDSPLIWIFARNRKRYTCYLAVSFTVTSCLHWEIWAGILGRVNARSFFRGANPSQGSQLSRTSEIDSIHHSEISHMDIDPQSKLLAVRSIDWT